MKQIISFLLAFSVCSSLIAQKEKEKTDPIASAFTVPTNQYSETFDANKNTYGWKETADYVIKDEAYQLTSTKPGLGYSRIGFAPDFGYKEGQDWILQMSMKRITGVLTSQWGIEIGQWKQGSPYINILMDEGGAYGTFGHMKFKIKKGFNEMKLVKTGLKLDVYFNGKLMRSDSIKSVPGGHFFFSQSEASESDQLVVQYDNIRYEVTKPVTSRVVSTGVAMNIPDINFKKALLAAGVDTNNDGEIQKNEAMLVKEINVYDQKITSMEGLQHFENLTNLNCATNSIETLDLSKNTNLVKLFCKTNKLTALDVSKNLGLEKLTCSSNPITELNLIANTRLHTIECSSNQLTRLHVAGLTNLNFLDCRWNKLTSLDVTNCKNLETLKCENNSIKEILASRTSNVDMEDEEWTKDETAVWLKR